MQNMSIKHKLILIVMATSITALLLAGTAFIICERASLHLTMEQHLSTEAEMIADNCKAAVAFKDAKDAKETLDALYAESSIIFGCIYTSNGEIFASYYNSDQTNAALRSSPASGGTLRSTSIAPQSSELKQDGSIWSRNSMTVFKPIILDGETIGTVCLRSNLNPIRSMLKRNTRIIIAVLLLVTAVACMMSSGLQRIISKPILNLAEVAKTISDKKDYSTRVTKQAGGEIGLLIEAFNEMLKQIQQRDSALVGSKQQLEKRTVDLMVANEQLTREVTERNRIEKALEDLNKDLESTIQKLSLANQQLQDFIHMAAHDLKSPLRAIGTLVSWLSTDCTDKFDESGKEKVKLIVGRAERMSKLIDGILQYSEITRIKEKEETVNLNAVLSEVIRDVHAPENIEIIIENKMPSIVCERTHIMQVFLNTLDNSVKYMDKPKGQIKIGCTEENGFWMFSVADNGRGIEEKYFERLFRMCQTFSPHDKTETTGIALAMAKKIIEMYGGKIWVESKAGSGSTFFFTMPKQGKVTANG